MWTLTLGLLARVVCWCFQTGLHHPDEVFQYLEPAYRHLSGIGVTVWEWERGARNWVLPALNGAWMWWGNTLGLDNYTVMRLLWLHNTLWSLVLIPAVYRLALLYGDRTAARVAALLCALFLPIIYFMPHTLSEVPGVLLTTWALVFWTELLRLPRQQGGRRALYAGLAMGAAIVIRYTLVFWAIVPGLALLVGRRWRALAWYSSAIAVCVAISGVVDWLTWGNFFHATIEYFEYNYVESGASTHGVSPWWYYFTKWLGTRAGVGGVVLGLLALWQARRFPWLLATALLPLIALSGIAHKEERFMLGNYPLLLVCGSIGLTALAARWPKRRRWVFSVGIAVVLLTSAWGVRRLRWTWQGGVVEGQQIVGNQPDTSGLMSHFSGLNDGGLFALGIDVPQQPFDREIALGGIFNYLILLNDSEEPAWALANGYQPVSVIQGEWTLFRRAPVPPATPSAQDAHQTN